jgi:hypothetical protein
VVKNVGERNKDNSSHSKSALSAESHGINVGKPGREEINEVQKNLYKKLWLKKAAVVLMPFFIRGLIDMHTWKLYQAILVGGKIFLD